MNEFVIKNGFISQGTSYVSDGNVGIGTVSPIAKLNVFGTSVNSQIIINNYTDSGCLSFLSYSRGNNQIYFDAYLSGGQAIATGPISTAIKSVGEYLIFCGKRSLTVGSSFIYDELVHISVGTGNVGIGVPGPSEKLDVGGKTKTINFQMTSGVSDGYVLTSDSLGNGTWQLPAPFTGNTSATSVTNLYIKNIYGTSPITIHDSIKSIGSQSTGVTSFAFGGNVSAFGDYSHAEGGGTIAIGNAAHAEGKNTQAIGNFSHAEGAQTISSGVSSHAQGNNTTSIGDSSHASGSGSTASGTTSFVHGSNSVAGGISTIVLGDNITGITNNTTYVNKLNIVLSGTPSSSLDPQGENGSVLWNNNYFYWKANNQWLRISGGTW